MAIPTHSTTRRSVPRTASRASPNGSDARRRRAAKRAAVPSAKTKSLELRKCRTGIRGLDEITHGGLPEGRATLVCGGAGSGKTLLGTEFLVRGARDYGEAGVFVSFEERPGDVIKNTSALGFDIGGLVARNEIFIDQVMIDRTQILETGEYSLDGLFIRLGAAIDAVGARRVVLDTIDVLFAALNNLGILRAELRRLFEWLKDRGVTTIVTAERGDGALTRHGLEEYVSDCVIVLDQRVVDQIATRRLRIAKYRGSMHGTNEYPFIIDQQGFVVLPITTITLTYPASKQRVPLGIPKLDIMLAHKGCYRGSTILVSGGAGTGKSSIAAHFVDAACRRGERALYFAFEEAPAQITRNMRSIGIDLDKWVKPGLLGFCALRPGTFGFEMLISTMLKLIDQFRPSVVVLDPVSSLQSAGSLPDAQAMLMRMIDLLKSRQITALFTSLTDAGTPAEQTSIGISSLIDTWILVRDLELACERTRSLTVLKSRGTKHSKMVREFLITDKGIDLREPYLGPEGVLAGSARSVQEAKDRAAAILSKRELEHKEILLKRKRKAFEARMAELQADYENEAHDLELAIARQRAREQATLASRRRELDGGA